MSHSLFWHTIHYLPMILTVAAFAVALFKGKLNEYKKYLAAFSAFGFSAHLLDSGFEFHAMEPCFFYAGVLVAIAATEVKTFFARQNAVAKTF